MKIFRATFLFAVVAESGVLPFHAGSMSQRDREHLTAHLQMTGSWLPDEVAHLSAAQLNYRPAPEKWTIAEVVEHLVIGEPNYSRLSEVVVSPVDSARKC